MAIDDYGTLYWCVKVSHSLAKSGEIFLHADRAEVTPNGDLIFWSSTNEKRKEAFQNLSLASGSWVAFFAASIMDGAAVAVAHWDGEIDRSK
jgi:hypothetical protein